MIRKPAVAGRFYPDDPAQLEAALREKIPAAGSRIDAKGLVVPHAGYVYSGGVAGATYAAVTLPRRFVILCPNHTGLGSPVAIMAEGAWQTPLGMVPIDEPMARRICRECSLVQENLPAHQDEHSLEVQLPFLQHLLDNDFQFVPIAVGTSSYESLIALGRALAEAMRLTSEPVLLIASSDMNHYEPAARTLHKDSLAIEKILALDARGLYDVIHRENISMCGYGPTICMLEAAQLSGARHAKLIEHTHSGETSGDNSSVVGYAGLVIY